MNIAENNGYKSKVLIENNELVLELKNAKFIRFYTFKNQN